MKNFRTYIIFFLISFSILFTSCGLYKSVDQRERPDGSKAKARKNVEEGRGISVGGVLGRRGGTNYEFSTSNPLWRASLEILDFLPLNTVDYSGGIIISDWYSDSENSNDSLKISVRFLSNEIRSDSVKIIIHKKICNNNLSCKVNVVPESIIKKELHSTILKQAALLEKKDKNKKK